MWNREVVASAWLRIVCARAPLRSAVGRPPSVLGLLAGERSGHGPERGTHRLSPLPRVVLIRVCATTGD